MEKVYRLLRWLDVGQSVDWLQRLTGTTLSLGDLLALCDSKQCNVYANVNGVIGVDISSTVCAKVIGSGMQKVLNPLDLKNTGQEVVELYYEGPVFFESSPEGEGEDEWVTWSAKTQLKDRQAWFRPDDIQALAAKINGEPEQVSGAELETLYQQLEQERGAREAAEAELLKRRAEDGKRTLDNMRHMLMHDHKEFSVMKDRAEKAELMVAVLGKQITEQAERLRRSEEIAVELGKRLSTYHKGQNPDCQPEAQTTCLTFPYATKELEAMRAAALKYWASYTPDKRQPTQVEIQIELCQQLGLAVTTDKEPPRRLKALASAIRPDALPEA